MKAYRIIFILCLLIILDKSNAQRVRLTSSLGTSAYLGDLVQGSPAFKEISPAFSIGASYDLQQQIRARLNISFLGVQGDDKYSSRADLRYRNLNFKSSVFEVSAMGEYDFLDREVYNIVPYVFGGPGFFHFNPYTTDRNGNKVYLQPLGTEGQGLPDFPDRKPYSLTQFNISFGIGLRYEISENLSIAGEFCYRKLFTDYLDDVSSDHGFVDPAIFAANGKASVSQLNFRSDELNPNNKISYNSPRGNPSNADVYYSFQISVSYRLENLFLGREYGSPFGKARTGRRQY